MLNYRGLTRRFFEKSAKYGLVFGTLHLYLGTLVSWRYLAFLLSLLTHHRRYPRRSLEHSECPSLLVTSWRFGLLRRKQVIRRMNARLLAPPHHRHRPVLVSVAHISFSLNQMPLRNLFSQKSELKKNWLLRRYSISTSEGAFSSTTSSPLPNTKTKTRARTRGYKHVWCRSGTIFVRGNDTKTPITIKSESDLEKLTWLSPPPQPTPSTPSESSNLKVAQLNANSLRSHRDFIKATLLDRSLHFISISETWLHSFVSDDLIRLENYFFIRNDREGKEGGGVACYIHYSLKARVLASSPNNFSVYAIPCTLANLLL